MYTRRLFSLFIILGLVFGLVSLVSAQPDAGITLDPTSATGAACIGHDVTYDIRITNNTSVQTSFTFGYSSIWPYEAPTVTPSLPIGDYWDFQVTVHIPWSADPGEQDTLSISAIGGGYSANATITTTANFINDWADYSNIMSDHGVRFHSAVYYDGRIYKIGGENNGAQAWLDIYDIESDIWSPGTAMPEERYYIDCEAIEGYIYCAGGLSTSGQSTLYIYEISSNAWSTGAELPFALYSYASVVLDGKYYLIGGRTPSTTYSDVLLAYDPILDSWDTTLSPMSTGRRFHSAGAIDGKIYVAGGYSGSMLASVEVYDPDLDTWSSVADMPDPKASAADGVYNGRYLVLAGGSSTSPSLPSEEVFIYDADFNAWQYLPNMDHQIYGAEGDGDGNSFWVISGQTFTSGVGYEPSIFTTHMDVCAPVCPAPVTGLDFSWDPVDPWTNFPVSLTAELASGASPIIYSWNFNDGTENGDGESVEHTFTIEDIYNVELTAANCDGTNTVAISHDVAVVDPPQISPDQAYMDAIQTVDMVTSQYLELCNDGNYPLDWTISEALPEQNYTTNQDNNPEVDIAWLSADPTSGTIMGHTCEITTISFDSIGLTEGVYWGNLILESNDPVVQTLTIPTTLSVSIPGIEFVKTISLQANNCGSTNNLVVYPNTVVYYCYTVTNIGGMLFNLHDLVDDVEGTILSGFSLDLDVAESYSYIYDGVEVSESVTNEATWTAHNGTISESSTDTATVTVIPLPDVHVFLPTILK